MNRLLSLPLLASLVVAGGCSSERTADSLSEGETAVVHLAIQEDGSLEATAVDVAEEDDGIDCEQEGEHEGENEGCDVSATATAEMIVGNVEGASTDELRVLGFDVDTTSLTDSSATSFWFRGTYMGANQFSGEVVKSSQSERLRMMGKITRVESVAGGQLTIEMFDRNIVVDGAMVLNNVQSLDDAAEADVDCEQEGEHEGENEGC